MALRVQTKFSELLRSLGATGLAGGIVESLPEERTEDLSHLGLQLGLEVPDEVWGGLRQSHFAWGFVRIGQIGLFPLVQMLCKRITRLEWLRVDQPFFIGTAGAATLQAGLNIIPAVRFEDGALEVSANVSRESDTAGPFAAMILGGPGFYDLRAFNWVLQPESVFSMEGRNANTTIEFSLGWSEFRNRLTRT